MHERNPYSRGLHAHRETIVAVAMLLGEDPPLLCSCCMGHGQSTGIFGGWRACGQCSGTGYDMIGYSTRNHFMELRIKNG